MTITTAGIMNSSEEEKKEKETEDSFVEEKMNVKTEETSSTQEKAESPPSEEKKGKSSKSDSEEMQKLQAYLKDHSDPEQQVREILRFMENALSQKPIPLFKLFWDAKKVCMEAFKKPISQTLRGELWNQYVEISKEARRLKDLLDEQSHFAMEQIEKAILAIEEEIQNESLEKVSVFPEEEFPEVLPSFPEYQKTQKELNLLNAEAQRITELRKELIKTDMRVRKKNLFFQRLSLLGDKVFPKRKAIIKEMSDRFEKDADVFVKQYFSDKEKIPYIHYLREQIKLLQAFAKTITLNTHAFNHTRLLLSQCWDQLNNWEKIVRKQKNEKRQTFKENFEELEKSISDFEHSWNSNQLSLDNAFAFLDTIQKEVRQRDLGHQDLRAIKERLSSARAPLLDKKQELDRQKFQEIEEEKKKKQEALKEIQENVIILQKTAENLTIDELQEKISSYEKDLIQLPKAERVALERKLKPVIDILINKKEQALLSDDDKQTLEKYRYVLEERKKRRKEVKEQLEILRKASDVSGLDIMQAMNTQAQIKEERDRIEKLDESIKEIEEDIKRLQP